jgi:uncharacterized Rmd1/YagE family protein
MNVMNSKVKQILDQITRLEDELNAAREEQQSQLHYQIDRYLPRILATKVSLITATDKTSTASSKNFAHRWPRKK